MHSFPETNIAAFYTATYYDTYGYYGEKGFNSSVNISGYSDNAGNVNYFDNVKSLVTGIKALVLDGGSTYLTTTTYYDDKYRPIQIVNDVYDGASGVQATGNKYDFIGQVTESKVSQTFNNVTTTVSKFYKYDHLGRLLKTEQQITGDATGKITLASKVEYVYDATGVKLKKRSTNTTATERYYAGLFEYGNTKALELIHMDEGVVNYSGTSYTYEYFLKDHLGNTRVTFKPEGGSVAITQVADYYPFGMSFGSNTSSLTNKYLYNGKELQDENIGGVNLDWYDYGARFYDPQIGRFTTVDPMAPFSPGISPYSYAYNDPINNIDYYGLGPFSWLWKFLVWIINDPSRATYSHIHDKIIWHQHSKTQTPPPHEQSNETVQYIPAPMPLQTNTTPSMAITPPKVPIVPSIPPDILKNTIFAGQRGANPEVTGHIKFKIQSADIDFENNANEEFLNKIVKTLVEYPQIMIEVKSNTADYAEKVSPQTVFNTSMARSRAIIKYLRSKGVLNKIIAVPGEHRRGGDEERTTTFKIF